MESRVGIVAYRLKLPSSSQIYHTLHVSQLKLFKGKLLAEPHIPGWMQGVDADAPMRPVAVLDRKLVKKANKSVVQFWCRGRGRA